MREPTSQLTLNANHMWLANWRENLPEAFQRDWDLVIVGGGITGAGILLEAARHGLKALLVEQRDFAWGASSRSSKLVHGGLRYLKQGKVLLTRASVRERENLLREAPGLVDPQTFAFPHYLGRKPGRWLFSAGLAVYDLLAGQRSRHYHTSDEFLRLAPHVDHVGLKGGYSYRDAKTDDARLVIRVLQEAVANGGIAVNYVGAEQLLRTKDGKICGLELSDTLSGDRHSVTTNLVINATGAWADNLRKQQGGAPRLRPLRGSHLVISAWRLPVAQAVSFLHPRDSRPVFAFPWEGVALVGTTDVDHSADLRLEPAITPAEVSYLMAAIEFQFPALRIGLDDILTTYAGLRPVVDSGKSDPSKEARDQAIWLEDGLLTVTGGKLTTFRLSALDALKQAAPALPGWDGKLRPTPIFAPVAPIRDSRLDPQQLQRLHGRYGNYAAPLIAASRGNELTTIPGTETLWAEVRWAARAEGVMRLEDLMLRRTRLGLQLRDGGGGLLSRIRAVAQYELGWNDTRWIAEEEEYLAHWKSHHGLPILASIPEWREG